MLRFLVINILIISITCSCSVNRIEHRYIVEKEIERQFLVNTSVNKFYYNFELNNYLKAFLIEEYDSLPYFKDEDKGFLLDQLKLKLSLNNDNRIIYYNFEKEGDRLSNLTKNRLYLSNPILGKDGDFAIIAVSSGVLNEMQGGVHLYKKNKKKWVFDSIIKGWIE